MRLWHQYKPRFCKTAVLWIELTDHPVEIACKANPEQIGYLHSGRQAADRMEGENHQENEDP